jgi:hypothetical protein
LKIYIREEIGMDEEIMDILKEEIRILHEINQKESTLYEEIRENSKCIGYLAQILSE